MTETRPCRGYEGSTRLVSFLLPAFVNSDDEHNVSCSYIDLVDDINR